MPKRNSSTNKAPLQKRAKRLNVRAALNDGSLLTGVVFEGMKVILHLSAAYNHASNYKSINIALYSLYQISSDFQSKFELPTQGSYTPVLRLKMNHGYTDENAILSALKEFAAPKKRLNVKAALRDGSLLTGVTLDELKVTLYPAAAYNQASGYKVINQALYDLYQVSLAFQTTFEPPNTGIHAPVLWLKENHNYADENAIWEALTVFAIPEKRLKVKPILRDGSLLTGVTQAGLKVTLHLAVAYNKASDYHSINKVLYDLYQISPAFQAEFEQPKRGGNTPILQLKEGHSYADENAILEALKAFAAPQKPLKIKTALNDGSLLTSVTLTGLQVSLHLHAGYNQASDYKSINHALYGLYQISSAFQARFEPPNMGTHVPVLQLKENHGYADGNAILSALKEFAEPQKRLNVKAGLKDGSLLTGATLTGLQVTLHVAAAYSQASDYKSINKALYVLYQISPDFQATFEPPKIEIDVPVLRLKKGHDYADGETILAALIGFAKGKIDKPLSEITSSEAANMAEQIPSAEEEMSNIPDVLLIEPFPQQTSNPLINSLESDLLALLGERLSDNQQSYSEVASSSMALPIEEASPLLLLSGYVDLEAKRSDQVEQGILGEINNTDFNFKIN